MIYPGLEVGGYVIEDELGRGGFGSVYLAVDEGSGERVAIKFLHPKSMRSESAQQGFIDEMINQARLSLNPNIVHIVRSVRYSDKQGQHLGMVMEYVDGEPLDMLIQRYGLLPATVAVPVFLQALNGLSYAHEHNMLHRDLKPGNIMVGKDGLVKIMDFGLSKLVQGSTAASESARAASLNYVAPERLAKHHVDQRSDIYSLGATLYEALTGVPPYEIEAGNWQQAEERHRSGKIADIREKYEAHPEELALLVKQALEPDPARRFASAKEMLQALQRVPVVEHKAEALPAELAAVTAVAAKLGLIADATPEKVASRPDLLPEKQTEAGHSWKVLPAEQAIAVVDSEKIDTPFGLQKKIDKRLLQEKSVIAQKRKPWLVPLGGAVLVAVIVFGIEFLVQANKREERRSAAERELQWRQEKIRGEEYAQRQRANELEKQRQELARQQKRIQEEEERRTREYAALAETPTTDDSDLSLDGVGEVLGSMGSRYNQQGIDLCNRGDFASAVIQFKKAAKANPSNAEYWNNIGYAYQKIEKYAVSNHFCEKALEITPDRAVAFGNMAYNCVKLNRLDDAVDNWVFYLSKLETEKKRQRGIEFMKRMSRENPDPHVGECVRRAFSRLEIPFT